MRLQLNIFYQLLVLQDEKENEERARMLIEQGTY